ncbi:MAG TPA: hypothetical protein VFS18_04305 [Actinomycetota bacterium]|nr:hypothetical protein [Actinomycetota bacterium]
MELLPLDVAATLERMGLVPTFERWSMGERSRFIRWINEAGGEERREGRIDLLIQSLSVARSRDEFADSVQIHLERRSAEIVLDKEVAAAALSELATDPAQEGEASAG